MKKIEFIIPFFPISINSALTVQRYNRSRRILTKEARQFKENTAMSLNDEYDILAAFKRNLKNDEIVIVEYILFRQWINKSDGKSKKIDADNYIKILQDVLFEVIGIDDRNVWDINIKKAHTLKKPFVYVKLSKNKIKRYIKNEKL